MRQLRGGRTCLTLLVVLGVTACSGASPGAPSTSAPVVTGAPSSPTVAAPPPAPSPASAPTSPTAPPSTSAQRDLAAFVDAAAELDRRLRATASLVNAGIHADAVVVDGPTAAAVQGLTLTAVASAVPAGLPPELMRPVLTTYSDLASRAQAMSSFRVADRTYSRVAPEGAAGPAEGEQMVACLANGTVAAQRFAADLAAVVTAARSTPPVPAVDAASLARAELQVRLAEIGSRNGGCGACGGYVATRLSTIQWDDAATSAATRTGTILPEASAGPGAADPDGVSFTAVYSPGTGWTVMLNAC